MNIGTKLNLPIIGGFAAFAIVGLWVMDGVIAHQGIHLTQDTMRSVLDSAEQAREATAGLHEARAFDMKSLAAGLQELGLERFRESAIYETVPIVAAWKTAGSAAQKRGFTFRVVRENPRRAENAPTPEERRILAEVEKPGVREFVAEDEARGVLVTARPIVMTRDCLICHGDPKTSPTGNGRDMLGFPMENWNEGDVRGAFILTSPIAPIKATARSATLAVAGWALPLVLVVCGAVFYYVRRFIVAPLHHAGDLALAISRGDLTRQVDASSADEIGALNRALNTTTDQLRSMIKGIATQSHSLAAAANTLEQTARDQASGTETANARANAVAAAGEELSVNATAMAEDSHHIKQAVTGVASSMEEMSASIQEVANNSTKGAEISHQADQQARATKERMGQLDHSAREISKIVDIINSIAAQTNLLALNASIEAASAGEAGRGFAVVANEVKELARQSASASEEIRKQIDSIQKNAGAAVGAIDEVSRVIQQVSQMTSSIAAAVEEQSATTSEVNRSLQEVSGSTASLTEKVNQAAAGTAEVSRNIHDVSAASAEAARSSVGIRQNAVQLKELASDLREIVARFRLDAGGSTAGTRARS